MLSLFFLYYAYRQLVPVRGQLGALARPGALLDTVALPTLAWHLLLLLLNLLVGSLLLANRRPTVPPTKAQDVLLPLAASFFFLTYNFVSVAPPWLRANLLPLPWRVPLGYLSLYLAALSAVLATWAVVHLGRSFALLVSVRKVVRSGPYRYVRHPMYSSYVLQMVGLVSGHGSILVLGLALAHFTLTVYRARLEETRLGEHSPEYREYQRQAGFFLPRVG